jgi:peptide/nickel transport system substrate-binding protein
VRYRGITVVTLLALLAGIAVSACGKSLPTAKEIAAASSTGNASSVNTLSPVTDPPTKDYNKTVTWATYRMVQTIDPVQAFDYPEDTVDTTLYDSLLRQNPDGTISPGVAVATYPKPTELDLTIRPGVKFWNGDPVTSTDVVYDLKRAAYSTTSFYGQVFSRVKSIVAHGPDEVTINLKQPDYWLQGELSEMPGVVYEKSYAENAGKNFGTPQGLTMGTGPYMPVKWVAGQYFLVKKNPNYWDSTTRPMVKQIKFVGIGDDASITSGLETGAIGGVYPSGLSTVSVLKADKNLTLSYGPSEDVDAIVICNLKGALGNVKVRQALSLAIDREAYIQAVYHGKALIPHTLENPGEWGYGQQVFAKDWNKLPAETQNIAKAKQLVKEAHATGKTLVIGTTQQVNSLATAADQVRQAGAEIGLKVKIQSVSDNVFINYFESAAARKGIDMFPTSNYPDYADPAAYYNTVVMPGASQNFDDFKDPAMVKDLNEARSTANPDLRAHYVAEAGDLIAKQLPWIPLAAPYSLVITQKQLTGEPSSFTYMGGPWANLMGGR